MTFGIIGYGSFGRLLVDVLKPYGKVVVYKRGAEGGEASGIHFGSFEEVANAEIVFLSVGLDSLEEVCPKLAGIVKPDALVVDVCSVKVKPVEIMKRQLRGKCRILPAHPLFGPHTTTAGTVAGKNFVICPVDAQPEAEFIDFLENKLSLKVVEMTPEEHDKQMAWIHGLTFFVGRGVMKLDPPKSVLATGYYQKLLDLVELESTHSKELFNTIERGNPYAAEVRQKLLDELKKIDTELTNE